MRPLVCRKAKKKWCVALKTPAEYDRLVRWGFGHVGGPIPGVRGMNTTEMDLFLALCATA